MQFKSFKLHNHIKYFGIVNGLVPRFVKNISEEMEQLDFSHTLLIDGFMP